MTKQGSQFDNQSTRRIVRTVIRSERAVQATTGQGRGTTPQILGNSFVHFTLTEDMGETTAGEASATIHKTWDPATETRTGDDEGVVVDPGDVFDEAISGAYGKGYSMVGNDRQVVDPVVIGC